MTIATSIRRHLLLACLVLTAGIGLVLPASASARLGETVDQGVVQSVSATSIALRRLDGTVVTVGIAPETIVRLNGRRSAILAVPPGAVARVTWTEGQTARLVQAVGAPTARTDEGVVVLAAPKRLVIRTAAGETLTVRLGLRTVVRRANGAVAGRRLLQPGATVRASHVPGTAALTVIVLARA